jgi:rod shape-determining protein MreD
LREALFLMVAGYVTLALQTTVLAFALPPGLKPDLMLIVVGWAGLRTTYGLGVAFAFFAGLAMDLMSGSPFGLFALLYCLAFFGCAYVHTVFPLDDYVGWATTICVAALLSGLVVVVARLMEGPTGLGLMAVAWVVLKSLSTAIAALAMLPCLDGLWSGYARIAGVR